MERSTYGRKRFHIVSSSVLGCFLFFRRSRAFPVEMCSIACTCRPVLVNDQVLGLMEENRQLKEAADAFEERLQQETRRAEKRRLSAANRVELEVWRDKALLLRSLLTADVHPTFGLRYLDVLSPVL